MMNDVQETGRGAQADPPRIRHASDAYRITQPVIVHSRADIASLLRAHRIASGMTCEQFDALAGWSDRYVTKLEHGDKPSCKQGVFITPPSSDSPDAATAFSGNVATSFMAEVWLETAGLRLVLMPADMAERIGAVPAPKREGAR